MPIAATAIATLTAAGSLLAMCQPVPPPPAPDTTPPVVVLDVHGAGPSYLTVPPSGASRTVPRTAKLDLIASARDPESGITVAVIEGSITKVCDSGDGETAVARSAHIYHRVPAASSTNTAVTSRIVTLSVDLGYLPCSRPTALRGTLRASGTNGAGLGASTGSFHFTYQL